MLFVIHTDKNGDEAGGDQGALSGEELLRHGDPLHQVLDRDEAAVVLQHAERL